MAKWLSLTTRVCPDFSSFSKEREIRSMRFLTASFRREKTFAPNLYQQGAQRCANRSIRASSCCSREDLRNVGLKLIALRNGGVTKDSWPKPRLRPTDPDARPTG